MSIMARSGASDSPRARSLVTELHAGFAALRGD